MKIVFIIHVSLCFIFVCFFPVALSQAINEDDVVLCGNSECTAPLAKAVALIQYRPGEEYKLHLKKKQTLLVYGKLLKKKLSLVKHDKIGKLGFVPSVSISETHKFPQKGKSINVPLTKIFPSFGKTPTEPEHVPGGVAAEAGNQTPASTPYDVLNGTTVFLGTDGEAIKPTATEEPKVTATTNPDLENVIDDEDADDDDGEDDGDDENEDDEEDLEADETQEEASTEQVQAIIPTKTENIQPELVMTLDHALNSEPGRNSETDEQILSKFGGSTQVVADENQPAPDFTSQLGAVPLVSDAPRLNQGPEAPAVVPSQVLVSLNPVPAAASVSAPETPAVGGTPVLQTPAVPQPAELPPTAYTPYGAPNIPLVPVPASVQVPEASSSNPTVGVPPVPGNPEAAVPTVNHTSEGPVPIAAPVQVPEASYSGLLPSNPTVGVPPVPGNTEAAVPTVNHPSEVPVPISSIVQVPEASSIPTSTPNPKVEIPPMIGNPEAASQPVMPMYQPPAAPTEPIAASVQVPEVPVAAPVLNENPENPHPTSYTPHAEPEVASPIVVPPTAGYPPNLSPEVPPPTVHPPNPTPATPEALTPENPEIQQDTRVTDDASSLLNETDHLSDYPEYTTYEYEAPKEAVPTPLPPSVPMRPMYPGLIGMPVIQNQIPPQAEASLETPPESVQAVVTEPTEEPAVTEQPFYESSPEPAQPEVVNLPSEPSKIEPIDQPEIPQVDINEPELPPTDTQELPGFFDSFTNPFARLFSSQSSEPQPEIVPESHPEISPQPEEKVIPDGDCKTEALLETSCDDAPTPQDILHLFDKTVPENSYISLYLLSTSITVLLFLLGYYFLERTRQDGPLVAKVNQLTHELQVAKAQQHIKNVDDTRSIEMNAAFLEAQEELNELRKTKADLENQLESLQQELDSTTEAGLEMNRMLSDLLAQRNASETLLKSVEHLQGQLNAQQQVIDAMNKSLTEKKEENEALQAELGAAQAKIDNLEEELSDMRNNLNVLLKEKETVMFDLEKTNMELQSELTTIKDARKTEVMGLNHTVADLKEKLKIRDSEYVALKQTVDDLSTRGGVDVGALYDVGNVRAELVRALKEKEELQERFSDEVGARQLLEDHVKAVDNEVQRLRLSFETAEKEKLEAETKLTVLSNYFKEKENQLHKELGLQEAMWAQKQGDETTIFETIKSLKDEVENYNFDSFNNLNESLSVTNSVSSLCTDAANFTSISPKLTEPLSSLNSDPRTPAPDPWNYPDKASSAENLSIRSLPINMHPKPHPIPRRKSSIEFEARLERAEKMTTRIPDLPRSIPEDLLKLTELKTVRASPFRAMSFSPDSEKSVSCSELVEKFEMLQKPGDVLIDVTPVPIKRTSIGYDKSESDESTSKDCEVTASSARVEFDIKVVANASSNVKKFRKKPSRPKDGAQNDTLKKEILDQERGLKGQIATLEKKAHENWVAARQAERRLEESKQEAGQLRNMLTLMEKSTVPDSDAKPSVRELNGEDILPPFLPDGSSPLPLPPLPLDPSLLPPGFMSSFLSPTLAGFMPPPPSLPGEHRPPPLGRMSSPPLNRYSPAPGDFNFDRMSPRPPVRSYRSPPIDPERFHHLPPPPWDDRSGFRPVANQRESRHDYPDSNPSSRPSSAGSLEKPPRRSQV